MCRFPAGNVHRMPAENPDHEAAAAAYEATLRAPLATARRASILIHLGLGTEGHTASLFPGSPALAERERWVAAPFVEKLDTYRITLTPPVLNAAREVQFLAAGKDKAAIVREILHAPHNPTELPAQVVAPTDGRLVWLLDTAAAGGTRTIKDHRGHRGHGVGETEETMRVPGSCQTCLCNSPRVYCVYRGRSSFSPHSPRPLR